MNNVDVHNMQAVGNRVGTQETLSGNTSSHSPQLEQLRPGFDSSDVSHLKVVLNGSGPCAASQRHIRTEQKRRDRINEGFVALQALLPGKEKVEKAVMLNQAADYIHQLQELMQQVLNCGAAKALPNELQWNLRMLLPRKADALAAGAILESTHPMPAPAPSSSAGTFQDPVITGTAPSQSQAAKVFQEVARPTVTAPAVQAPQYGMPYSEAQPTPQISLGANISQGQVVHSEPAASTAVSGGMLIADPQTLSQLQALVHQQQAVQGWHNASHLLQALHMQQQLQQTAAGSSVGITVTPQMLQQLSAAQNPMHAIYQPSAAATVSVGVPVTSHGIPVSGIATSMGQSASVAPMPLHAPSSPPHASPAPQQAAAQFPQPPQPTSTFAPAATSAFSTLAFPTSTSAFTPAGSGHLSGLHQLMEAANASDEEKDGINSFDTRALKRPRCYPSGPPRMAKAGILV